MDKYDYYEKIRSKLEKNNINVLNYTEISYGLQFYISYNEEKELIRIYESQKNGTRLDLSQIKDENIYSKINEILNQKDDKGSKKYREEVKISFPKTLKINSEELKIKLEELLKENGAQYEDSPQEYIEGFYNVKSLKITFFTSGKILFQGKSTLEADKIFFKVADVIKQKHTKEFEEEIEQYFENSFDFSKYIEENETENFLVTKGEKYLGKELFNYLNLNDQIDFLDAISLYEFAENKEVDFNNFAILVRNFAIVFEGFLIKVFVDTNILSEKEYEDDVRTAIGSKLAKKEILNFIKLSSHNKHIAVSLENVWQTHRNKSLHSDYMAPKKIPNFERAENDINEIIKVMKECYNLLDFEKINKSSQSIEATQKETIIENIDIKKALIFLVENGFSLKQQKNAKWIVQKGEVNIVNVKDEFLKIITPENQHMKYVSMLNDLKDNKISKRKKNEDTIIGVDESGKGDFFGPLVIAGVYINPQIKSELIKIGVEDSKKLSDTQIGLLASKIKNICEYSIITIGNKRYNELYDKMKNLNKILAWGHARAIENVLEKENCNSALSDQFADEKFIKDALMEKGKEIVLKQRPRAEENIAVAAASILARNEFISRIKKLTNNYGLSFPKGASKNVITTGKSFIKKYNKRELKNVAKLHFKTTEKVTNNKN